MRDSDFPPGWRVVTANVTGPYHLDAARENQDAARYRRLGSGFLLAVADGAGSRSRSALGAQLVVDAAADAASTVLGQAPNSPEHAQAQAQHFRQAFLETFTARLGALLAAAPGHQAGDYAATLLVVVAHPPFFIYLTIGDCFMIFGHGLAAHLVLGPDGDAVANETVFITSHERDAALRSEVLVDETVTGIAIATDGLAEATLGVHTSADGRRQYVAPATFGDYFTAFAGSAGPGRLAEQFASSEFADTSGDDKTMIIAVRK